MRILLNGRDVSYVNNDRVVGFETDNNIVEFICVVEDATPDNWEYKLDIKSKQGEQTFYNTISLSLKQDTDNEYSVLLKAGMLPRGKCLCNIRRVNQTQTYISDTFEMWVKKSVLSYCGAYQEQNFIPSEFYQIEQRIDSINSHPPVPDESGYWKIWDADLERYVISDIPVGGGGSFVAGEGITVDGNKISIKTDNKSIAIDKNNALYVQEVDGGDL